MKKKIPIGIGLFVFAAIIFGGGFAMGVKFGSGTFGFSRVTEAYVEMLPTWMAVRQVDREDYIALKTSLNLKLDGEILKLNLLVNQAKSGKDVEKAKKLLKIIAEHRTKYPPVYSAYSSSKNSDVYKAVSDILASYR
jgi:hypothetical protein